MSQCPPSTPEKTPITAVQTYQGALAADARTWFVATPRSLGVAVSVGVAMGSRPSNHDTTGPSDSETRFQGTQGSQEGTNPENPENLETSFQL